MQATAVACRRFGDVSTKLRVRKLSKLMEVESTRVHVRPDGKKLIDVTLRRQGGPPEQAPLVVPQFDEDDSSSDSSDDDQPSSKPAFLQNNNTCLTGGDNYNDDDDDSGANGHFSRNHIQQTFKGDAQWDRVQEIQELTNANATLTSEARDLRQQIKALQIQLEAQTPVPGLDVGAVQDILLENDNTEHDVRDVKIVHQAKMLRSLKRSMQREKQLAVDAMKRCKEMESTSKKLGEEVDTLKLKLQRFQARATAEKNNHARATNQPTPSPEPPTSFPIDSGNDNNALKRLNEELKVKNGDLQQELKKAQRALVREVGDDVSLEDILGNTDSTVSGASRRGRAQHIIMLKAKVKKLQTQLATVKVGGDTHDSSATSTVLDVDKRAQQDLSGQQMHRQKLLDQLTNQRDELQERVHRLTRKYDALKARAQILDREKQETRNKFQVLVEKSRTDDALVDALQRQLETWKMKLHEARRARTADGVKSNAIQEERAELERLRKIVAEHKSRGSEVSAMMPQPSEASQYRSIAAEKERLVEVVRGLKAQLEDRDKQLRGLNQQNGNNDSVSQSPNKVIPSSPSLPPLGDENVSRIPRRPGSKIPLLNGRSNNVSGPPAPSAVMIEQQQQQLKHEMETLRKTFRESMREKDERIAELEQQQRSVAQSTNTAADIDLNAMNQEMHDLQVENDYLRQEFDKLKTRYEALVKPSAMSSKKRNNTMEK